MKANPIQGVFGAIAIALAAVANGQQSTPPAATEYAPAAPVAKSVNPTTDTSAPTAGVTSGPSAATGGLGDRPNEQSAEVASPAATNATSSGTFPTPMPRQAGPLDQQPGSGTSGGGVAQSGGQRGELGVWLVETGGPGVQIRRVTEGSAAARAGLQPGDVILGINGRGASTPQIVAQMIRQMLAGQTATLQIWRDGQTNELEIELQPAREQYAVGFRGDASIDGTNRANGDWESRVTRLEQQLATVLQELRELRQSQHARGQTTTVGGGIGEATTTTGGSSGTATDAATITKPGVTAPSATTPTVNAIQPATQPEPAPATTPAPATEPAPGENDLFGAPTTEQPAANEAEPATTEPAPAKPNAGGNGASGK